MRRNGSDATSRCTRRNWARRVRFTFDAPPTEHFASYVFGCLALARAQRRRRAGAGHRGQLRRADGRGPVVQRGAGGGDAALPARAAGPAASTTCRSRSSRSAPRSSTRGVRCGIMDQMASSLAATDRALLIDTRTLERRDVPAAGGQRGAGAGLRRRAHAGRQRLQPAPRRMRSAPRACWAWPRCATCERLEGLDALPDAAAAARAPRRHRERARAAGRRVPATRRRSAS